jgi:hypothetical protein
MALNRATQFLHRLNGLRAAKFQGAAGFPNPSGSLARSNLQCGGEPLEGQFPLAEPQVGHAATV